MKKGATTFGKATLCITKFSILTPSIAILSIVKFSEMTQSIKVNSGTMNNISVTMSGAIYHNVECRYTDCCGTLKESQVTKYESL